MEENSGQSSEKQARASSLELLGQECPRHAQKRVYPMWLCPVCGTKTWITNKKRHLETKKHKDVVYISTERFEMRR